jgi:hypothetical protein
MCSWIDNQWSSSVVTARFDYYVQSLHHQHQDLHHLIYLILLGRLELNL